MIPLWALGLLKNKWTWVVVGTVVAIAVLGTAIVNYGQKRYDAGVIHERVVWQTVVTEAVTERNRLNAQLRAAQAERDQISADLRSARAINLNHVREEIHNAETVADIYSVYVAHHNSVRDGADTDLARARADYLSSLNSGNNPSPGGNGFADRVLLNPRTSRVFFEPGSVVGYGIG